MPTPAWKAIPNCSTSCVSRSRARPSSGCSIRDPAVRIVAGAAKGTRLAPVPAGTRPMSDRAREGLFSSLGGTVEEARVLDLFAGSGAIGIEALSRGAESALLVDSAPVAIKAINENLGRTKLARRGKARRTDALRAVRDRPGTFDLVFLAPPYRLDQPCLYALLVEIAGQAVLQA